MSIFEIISIICIIGSILVVLLYIFYIRNQEKAKNSDDKEKSNYYERKNLIITFIVAIILALPGFITELSNISERITPPPPINEIDNNTTEKNVPEPNPAGNNTYSLHTFTGGFVNIKDSTSEECHLYPGKYILKVSELDKKIKLEIRTKDKVIFSDIVSNMEKEINIETEDIYNICLHYFEGSTKYIVALKGIENNSTSYEFYSGIVHIGESNHYGCKLSPGRYTLNISELDYNVKLEILNKGNIIFSDIVSNMNTDINIDVEDNYDFYISYHNGFTKYKIELNET